MNHPVQIKENQIKIFTRKIVNHLVCKNEFYKQITIKQDSKQYLNFKKELARR